MTHDVVMSGHFLKHECSRCIVLASGQCWEEPEDSGEKLEQRSKGVGGLKVTEQSSSAEAWKTMTMCCYSCSGDSVS